MADIDPDLVPNLLEFALKKLGVTINSAADSRLRRKQIAPACSLNR
jgi:hypothetical protein